MDMVGLNDKYGISFTTTIGKVYHMTKDEAREKAICSLREDFGKLGLYASAAHFLSYMNDIRESDDDFLVRGLYEMAMECMLTISWYTEEKCDKISSSQIELFRVKNRRYGNSFSECYRKDGKPYAYGHLQEKINCICSLLILDGDDAKEEPIIDSYRDLFGYCVLTIMELE